MRYTSSNEQKILHFEMVGFYIAFAACAAETIINFPTDRESFSVLFTRWRKKIIDTSIGEARELYTSFLSYIESFTHVSDKDRISKTSRICARQKKPSEANETH